MRESGTPSTISAVWPGAAPRTERAEKLPSPPSERARTNRTWSTRRRPRTPLPHFLHAPTQFVLNTEIHRALHRRHELREIALLALGQIQPLPLDADSFVKQLRHTRLIRRITSSHLPTESLTHLPFLTQQLHALALVASVHAPELLHLRVVQVEATPHNLSQALLELTSERRLIARSKLLRLLLSSLQTISALSMNAGRPKHRDDCERDEEVPSSLHCVPSRITGSTGE